VFDKIEALRRFLLAAVLLLISLLQLLLFTARVCADLVDRAWMIGGAKWL
jgi:hypothetical protein